MYDHLKHHLIINFNTNLLLNLILYLIHIEYSIITI